MHGLQRVGGVPVTRLLVMMRGALVALFWLHALAAAVILAGMVSGSHALQMAGMLAFPLVPVSLALLAVYVAVVRRRPVPGGGAR